MTTPLMDMELLSDNSKMTKKDYITIANALKPFYDDSELEHIEGLTELEAYNITVTNIVLAISKALSKDNPKFNPVRFLDYIRQ